MDEFFARFIENFGPPIERREVPLSTIERYRNKLPSTLLAYWSEHGWAGYGEGIFWLVNPQEYDAVVSCWIQNSRLSAHDAYHLIARSAFGDLYFWGERSGFSLKITSVSSQYVFYKTELTKVQLENELRGFIISRKVDSNDFNDLFAPAVAKLGRLKHDEMYGFFPALMLGGSDRLEHLKKVSAVEHLIFLAQLTDLEPYAFSSQPD
ncbi:GAD-like domain-containing protein [Pseudomonas sp. NBRC 111124]|uniref:GAD-like domain-containing protein n=1 Tax=Pseudomonas sp. NBRC 111124 TaxID=1661039 RepID=UPI000761EFDD|nr:GAD-like domain-containing protein [Pseudomonas sp. NBRC 111124]